MDQRNEAERQHVRARLTERADVVERGHDTSCWISNRARMSNGYTRMYHSGKLWLTHRLSYEAHRGPIPDGLVIDHLCRQRACINPDHLEPVTMRINLIRGEGFIGQQSRRTHCIHDHPLAGENLYVSPRGTRHCQTCRRASRRRSAHAA